MRLVGDLIEIAADLPKLPEYFCQELALDGRAPRAACLGLCKALHALIAGAREARAAGGVFQLGELFGVIAAGDEMRFLARLAAASSLVCSPVRHPVPRALMLFYGGQRGQRPLASQEGSCAFEAGRKSCRRARGFPPLA